MESILSDLFLFGDNWSLAFFGALTSVGALFVFKEEKMKKNYENPNVKVAFFKTKDVISASNDLEIDIKRSTTVDTEENDIYLNF